MANGSRELILERNKELRKNPGVIKDWQHGRLVLSVPVLDDAILHRTRPELFEGTIDDRKRALSKFLASPESEPYRVR